MLASESEIVDGLRGLVGLPPEHRPAGEKVRVDVHKWIAWCVLGLRVLSALPQLEDFLLELRRFYARVVLGRARGNTTHGAEILGVSRRTLRTNAALSTRLPPGTRVVAIAFVEGATAYIYGRGQLTGAARPPDGTRTSIGVVGQDWSRQFVVPRIELDDGRVVWGPQCTWMTEYEFALAGREEQLVPLPVEISRRR